MNHNGYSFVSFYCGFAMLSILILTACSGIPSPASFVPPSPTVTIHSATATPTLDRNTTLLPTVTPEFTHTPAATPIAIGEAEVIESYLSPNGQWRIAIVAYPCRDFGEGERKLEQLQLTDTTTEISTVIQTQERICDKALGAIGLGGFFWSPDSQIFYYTDAREGVPDGGGGYCWNRPLWALYANNTTTKRLAQIWSRSEESEHIAMRQESDLVLQDLDGRELQRVPLYLPDDRVCQILWSPKGESLVYLQSPHPFEPSLLSVLHFIQDKGETTILLELDSAFVVIATWETPKQVKLSGMQEDVRREWTIDLAP